jgi:hypothetical protein
MWMPSELVSPPPPPPPLLGVPTTLPLGFPPPLPIHGGPPLAGVVVPSDLAIDWNSPEAIRIEQAITFTYGRKFAERGPPPPAEGGPDLWRNQKFREASGRWGNRGGKHRHEWTSYYNKGTGDKGKGKSKDPTASSSGGDKGQGKSLDPTASSSGGGKGKCTGGDKGKGKSLDPTASSSGGDKGKCTGGGKGKCTGGDTGNSVWTQDAACGRTGEKKMTMR